MKYLATIRNALVIVAILLLNPIVIAGHTSAMPTMSHETRSGSHHSSMSQAPSCVAQCTTVTLKDDEESRLVSEEQDDEPIPPKSLPYYALHSNNFIPKKLTSSYAQQQLIFRPPDLVKLYSNYRF